ncbi:MAG: DUF2064 domain-containing protein [Thermoanaerobaculia bacterium]
MNGLDTPAASPPTLLVFTLGDERESRRRQLLPAAHGAIERRLHRACLDAALAAGRDAGCRLAVSSPSEVEVPADVRRHRQRGRSFGRRLRNAFADTLTRGGGPVVLVGTDVPGLEPEHVRRAVTALEEDPERVVLGPSPDGGFYLLAAARPLDDALAAARWCCQRTLRSLTRALRRQGRRVVLLPALEDLDRRADLERWLASSSSSRWSRLAAAWRSLIERLVEILAEIRRSVIFAPELCLRPLAARIPPLRGPPLRVRQPH